MIGEILSKLMEERGLTAYKLSKLSGISQAQISRFKSGENKPSLHNIELLANSLGVSADYLLGNDEGQSDFVLTPEEYAIVRAWRACPDEMKPAVLRLLGIEASREASVVS